MRTAISNQRRQFRRVGCAHQGGAETPPYVIEASPRVLPLRGAHPPPRCRSRFALSNTITPSVTVHASGSSDGCGWPSKWAVTADVRKVRTSRCCWRQVVTTLSSVSTNRLPDALCVPNDSFRQITA